MNVINEAVVHEINGLMAAMAVDNEKTGLGVSGLVSGMKIFKSHSNAIVLEVQPLCDAINLQPSYSVRSIRNHWC